MKCESVKCEGTACGITDFEVPYDHLLVAVGATTNTFGIPGTSLSQSDNLSCQLLGLYVN